MQPAKRRVLFLVTTADWGGVQHFIFETAKEALRRGFEVLVAKGGHGELGERCSAAGIPATTIETLRRNISPIHDLAAIYEVRKLIRSFKPDVVHLNSSKIGVIGSYACHLERVPRTIYRIGGWSFLEDIGSVSKSIYLHAERATAKYKDVIVTVHPGDEAIARKEGIFPRGFLKTIPNGVDVAAFDRALLSRVEARRQLGISDDRIVIGSTSNFYAPKNIPAYLEMIGTAQTNPRAIFAMIGDGPEVKRVHEIYERLGLKDRVVLAGRRPDASSLLSAFDLFVLPSTKEGMPWGLLEAMAARLPCVTTDVGACRWMLEPDAGVIVPSNDGAALLNAISTLTTDEHRRTELGQRARQVVETRFQWETTVNETLKLFE